MNSENITKIKRTIDQYIIRHNLVWAANDLQRYRRNFNESYIIDTATRIIRSLQTLKSGDMSFYYRAVAQKLEFVKNAEIKILVTLLLK